jgi:hypothetical protein
MNAEKIKMTTSRRPNVILRLLNIKQNELNNYIVNFAEGLHNNGEALNAYYRAEFKEWQEVHLKRSLNRKFILSLIYFRNNEWLFAGFYEIITDEITQSNTKKITTKLLDINSDLIGKLVLSHLKNKEKIK